MKVYIETYGCTANKSDERLLVGLLVHEGHQIVYSLTEADVLVLITCTVIGTTEQRMLSRLKVFKKEHKMIIVTGCMPSVQEDLIRSITPNAFLLPARYMQYIIDILYERKPSYSQTKKTLLPKQYDSPIAPILIAEGCIRSCAYCITHFARGKLHSFPATEIISDVQTALKQGCKEIQLTAQDTASYGLDIGTNLGELLSKICSLDKIFRVRIGMMNPATLKENLKPILTAYRHDIIYKFLHLPIQSGDDELLKKMKRGYSTANFIQLLKQFRNTIPSLTLSTDVIIGFPTESEEQFERTLHLLKEIQADIVNITRFSARPHTPAKKMKGRIPTDIVKDRSKRTTELCLKITLMKNQKHIGKIYKVLVTEKGKHKTYTGRAENYKPVVLTEQVSIGEFVCVEITRATPTYLVGKLI